MYWENRGQFYGIRFATGDQCERGKSTIQSPSKIRVEPVPIVLRGSELNKSRVGAFNAS